ncbi:MAG: outer membrane protein assembly factor BamE [Thalassospira sp.]|uniref:outer membrane protein assembly factor BamE n=1 Tax=Thalassospira sp. TaxID=1912094 RepID=UPI0032ECAFD5
MSFIHNKITRTPLVLLAGLAVAYVSACSPRIASRGNAPEPEMLEQITIGESTKGDVTDILGSPSTVAAFDENVWLYISKTTETVAFFEPETVEQKVVLISFDAANRVEILSEYDLEDGKPVIPTDRVTPTAGREMTILQQLFGNLGRFSEGK